MSLKPIRIGQLIAPFGPGSLYTDRHGTPHVVCGLDHWHMTWDNTNGLQPCGSPGEFERFERRLSSLLRINQFRIPPDYRMVQRGANPPPNARLEIPAQRFPRWYRNTRTGDMKRFNLHTEIVGIPDNGGRWQPVRFIAVCPAGHLCEFPWKEWIDCSCPGDGQLKLIDHGGSELSSIWVKCESCPESSPGRRGRSLSGSTTRANEEQGIKSPFQEQGIVCPGDRPWLGERANEPCSAPLVGALINQTNIYFPRIVSAIAIPGFDFQSPESTDLRLEIERLDEVLGSVKVLWRMGRHKAAAGTILGELSEREIRGEEEDIREILEDIFDPAPSFSIPGNRLPVSPEPELLAFRRAEFDILRNEVNEPEKVPDLRVIASTPPEGFTPWVSRVNLVERLKETRVFYGFDRLEPAKNPLADMPGRAMRQLFRDPPESPSGQWLPAIEVFGEGIYVELREERILEWQRQYSEWINNRIDDAFLARLSDIYQTLPPCGPYDRDWASRYLMTHSLAHIMINQLVFECGYSAAALRERLYISADFGAPMAAFLIYTAAGDSDGSLGGLIQLGRPERLGPTLLRALSRASWCSADPICSEQLGGHGSRLVNHAACHACILLPETSCETINQGLDRAMIVGTPDNRQHGFFADILEQAHSV